eukprot:TRINITY_DN4436_c0_g1_i1.p1 TRINITY_DN4436_c0_g1~~TRINITY_DN4436_c0_g1_i1.p1  ORF type:complete len:514 (-),score=127.03 TRINITY_DN4436_c0_g1_i1:61-1602(-)
MTETTAAQTDNQGGLHTTLPKSASKASLHQFQRTTEETAVESIRDLIESWRNNTDVPQRERNDLISKMDGFVELFQEFIQQRGKRIDWNKINPPGPDRVLLLSELPQQEGDTKGLLDKLAVLKLNGGLGTTMGCVGPKSAIEVHSNFTFLDLTVHQIQHLNKVHGSNVPLLLMNSFNTHDQTKKIIRKYENSGVSILNFNQSRYPRILKDSLTPMANSLTSPNKDWFPPGHGDVYTALYNSGYLESLIQTGKEYLFISNVDNLGATVDFQILKYMADHPDCEFLMEVTNKSRADVKGGTLIDYEGKTKLLEIAQVPEGKVEEFKSVSKFKIFNTNNLWVSLKAIKRLVDEQILNKMDIIINQKTVDGKPIYQLERAAGAAIEFFKGGLGLNVPRSRFLPVKGTSDLFVVQSNLYSLKEGELKMNNKRQFPELPLVKLGDHFTDMTGYEKRFSNIPDILDLHHLTVSGDVYFGANVVLKGTVIIVATPESRIDIPPGSVLENKVVTGHLRLLDH